MCSTTCCPESTALSGVGTEQSGGSAAFCCSVILVWPAFWLLLESAGSAESSHPGNEQNPGKDSEDLT